MMRMVGLAICVIILGGERFVSWLRKGDFGDPCDDNSRCHSALCIPGADPAEVARARVEYEARLIAFAERLEKIDDDETRAAIAEEEKPNPPWLAPVYPGTCTVSCEEEACPPGWHCVSIREVHELYGFGEVKKVCSAPDDAVLSGSGE